MPTTANSATPRAAGSHGTASCCHRAGTRRCQPTAVRPAALAKVTNTSAPTRTDSTPMPALNELEEPPALAKPTSPRVVKATATLTAAAPPPARTDRMSAEARFADGRYRSLRTASSAAAARHATSSNPGWAVTCRAPPSENPPLPVLPEESSDPRKVIPCAQPPTRNQSPTVAEPMMVSATAAITTDAAYRPAATSAPSRRLACTDPASTCTCTCGPRRGAGKSGAAGGTTGDAAGASAAGTCSSETARLSSGGTGNSDELPVAGGAGAEG